MLFWLEKGWIKLKKGGAEERRGERQRVHQVELSEFASTSSCRQKGTVASKGALCLKFRCWTRVYHFSSWTTLVHELASLPSLPSSRPNSLLPSFYPPFQKITYSKNLSKALIPASQSTAPGSSASKIVLSTAQREADELKRSREEDDTIRERADKRARGEEVEDEPTKGEEADEDDMDMDEEDDEDGEFSFSSGSFPGLGSFGRKVEWIWRTWVKYEEE